MQQEKAHCWGLLHQEERHGTLFTTHRKRAGYKTCYHGSLAICMVAILANLLLDSENLENFESVWLQIFWFGDLANFWQFLKAFGSKIFGLAKYTKVSFFVKYSLKMCSSVILCTPCIFVRIFLQFICRVTIFELADGLKIRGMN